MAYRIFMTIDRGMTDKTPVCVFPWERQLQEEVHGAGAEAVSIETMLSKDGVKHTRPIKMPTASAKDREVEKALTQREQLERMLKVAPEDDPFLDLETEWGRLIDRYGMHREVNIPVAEKVFGTFANFRRAVQSYKGSKPPRVDPLDDGDDEGVDEALSDVAPADMNVKQLKAALDERHVDYKSNASRETLEELLTESIAGEVPA